MISFIVPIHNQYNMNKIFLHYFYKYTKHPFELIVINNNSNDNSEKLFDDYPNTKIINNNKNLCYSCSINLGIKAAQFDLIGLLNNDIVVSPGWNMKLTETLLSENLSCISPIGIENMGNNTLSKVYRRKWQIIKNFLGIGWLPFVSLLQLKLALLLMYGNWEKTNKQFKTKILKNGIAGNCHIVRKSLVKQSNLLTPGLQAADWDLFISLNRLFKLKETNYLPPKIFTNVYVHHYIKLTAKQKITFDCDHKFIQLSDKWLQKEINEYWYNPHKNN